MKKCQKIVHPLAKGAVDYQCTRPHWDGGWCKIHHPEIISQKEAENKLRQKEYAAERKAKLEQTQGPALTIESAIVLLVQSGYRVELVMPNNGPKEE